MIKTLHFSIQEDPINSAVMPVCLPWNKKDPKLDSLKVRKKLSITGWGRTTESSYRNLQNYLKDSVGTKTLRKIQIPVTMSGNPSHKTCKKINTKRQFCAGGIEGKRSEAFILLNNKKMSYQDHLSEVYINNFVGFDSCSGDSGGPAMYREINTSPWYQLGIISYGAMKCGQKDHPGIYTLVEAFLPWIEHNLRP